MEDCLVKYIKYCHGYVNLTKKRILSQQQKDCLVVPWQYLKLSQIATYDLDNENCDRRGLLIDLAVFYTADPKDISKNDEVRYELEKGVAYKLEDLYGQYSNDSYTKQIYLHFGRVILDSPIIYNEKNGVESNEFETAKKFEAEEFRLFSLPVKIEKIIEDGAGKYFIRPLDTDVRINIGIFEGALGEQLYLGLLQEIGKTGIEDKLVFPLEEFESVFHDIWSIIKAQLRLGNIQFSEASFELDNLSLAMSPRVNYFLSEDLTQLAKLPEDQLENAALSVWAHNKDLNIKDSVPNQKQLYFPFPFDKSQLEVLSLIKNKAAIVQGPPGTGKSTTIANILCHLAANGHKVLFVSQKAQALKVVKDKLKSINVRYLFSYIPNPASEQINEDDQNDGIAPQLSSLGSYIEKIKIKNDFRAQPFLIKTIKDRDLEAVVEDQSKVHQSLNKFIEDQRAFYKLCEEYSQLSEFEINLEDQNKFAQNLSEQVFDGLINLVEKISELEGFIKEYEQNFSDEKKQLDRDFLGLIISHPQQYSEFVLQPLDQLEQLNQIIQKLSADILNLQNKIDSYDVNEKVTFDNLFGTVFYSNGSYLKQLKLLKNDLETTCYDGNYSFIRSIKNTTRRLRLANVFKALPRELLAPINAYISQDYSRLQVTQFMNRVVKYFEYIEFSNELEQTKQIILEHVLDCIDKVDDQLPGQVMAWIKQKVYRYDISFNEIEVILHCISRYFNYKETSAELLLTRNKFNDLLHDCGVTKEVFFVLVQKKQNGDAFTFVKKNILRVLDLKLELDALKHQINKSSRIAEESDLQKERAKVIATYMQNIIDQKLIANWDCNVPLKQVVRKMGSALGKSKKAFKTFDKIRKASENFKEILNLVPIWIMELDDASRVMPLEPNLFDYVILDEASQCNIAYTLPVMYRTKRILFVGDSEQMRDSTVSFKSNRDFDELAHRFQIPEENQIKATGSCVQSVLDIAYKRGIEEKTLRYHYRSSAELIGFSNEYFYKPKDKELIIANSKYLTYKDTNRTMVVHPVTSDWRNEIDDQINIAEAEYILGLFRDLRADEKYKNKSIGILTFFSKQALCIRDLFRRAGFNEEDDNYKVSNIEGIQGDEKDIVIYSFVIRNHDQKNKYVPLTGESGDIRAEVNSGRVNVAFSRAREQVHCCVSMPLNEVPDKIWIKKYLEYVEKNGVVKHARGELKPFDSYFEEKFYELLSNQLSEDYTIHNQIESCGFKIDFVVANVQTGKRIAIECDGPCHFADELDEACGIHVEDDVERQRVLESAGWRFYRIRYSDWLDRNFKRATMLDDIKKLLD